MTVLPRQRITPALFIALAFFLPISSLAQETSDDVLTQSLPLRTALHHDPTLAAPLDRLLDLFRKENRVDELVGMYRAHTAQYPLDMNGRTVLVRLLAATGDPEALTAARQAVTQFPQNGYLHFLLYQRLRADNDPQALDALDKAIELEPLAARKVAWIDLLVPAALLDGRRDLAKKHLEGLAQLADTPERCVEVARKMNEHEFHDLALALLTKSDGPRPAPETGVDLELEAARAEIGLKRNDAAAKRLDALLAKLTADYWRRPEIVRRRLALVISQEER
ncbi:MAG: tetratricopeptide repeat protein, partial [Planctomycetaceae bacterium]